MDSILTFVVLSSLSHKLLLLMTPSFHNPHSSCPSPAHHLFFLFSRVPWDSPWFYIPLSCSGTRFCPEQVETIFFACCCGEHPEHLPLVSSASGSPPPIRPAFCVALGTSWCWFCPFSRRYAVSFSTRKSSLESYRILDGSLIRSSLFFILPPESRPCRTHRFPPALSGSALHDLRPSLVPLCRPCASRTWFRSDSLFFFDSPLFLRVIILNTPLLRTVVFVLRKRVRSCIVTTPFP